VTQEGEAKSRQAIRRLAREKPRCADRSDGVLCHAGAERSRGAADVVDVVTDKRKLPICWRSWCRRYSHRHLEVRRSTSRLSESAGRVPTAMQLLHHPRVRPHVMSRRSRISWRKFGDCLTMAIGTGTHRCATWGITAWNSIAASHRRSACGCRIWHVKSPDSTGTSGCDSPAWKHRGYTRVSGDRRGIPGQDLPALSHLSAERFGSDPAPHARRWGIGMFQDRCQFVRDSLPLPALTTDVIVGFRAKPTRTLPPRVASCGRWASRKSMSFRSALATRRQRPTCPTRCPQV